MSRNQRHPGNNSRVGSGGAVTGYNPRLIDVFAVLRPRAITERAVPEDLSWQDDALCPETDPEAFFPEKGGSTREAKRVCRGCEVRVRCLEYALEHDIRFGIWGGMSERERNRIKREHRPAADAVAGDEAAFYARLEAKRPGTSDEPKLAAEREKRRVQREALQNANPTRPRKAAA